MKESTREFLERVIEGSIGGANHDVYDKRLNTPGHMVTPWVVYFYYLTFAEGGLPSVLHYYYKSGGPILPTKMEDVTKDLAWRVRNRDTNDIAAGMTLCGHDFYEVEWKHKSYIVVFMDSPFWRLFERANHDYGGVVVNAEKKGSPNHSFFDARNMTIDMSHDDVIESRSAIYLINHMKKSEFADDLGFDQAGKKTVQREPFTFDMYFEVGQPRGLATVFIIDPDGTNVGPPLPPP